MRSTLTCVLLVVLAGILSGLPAQATGVEGSLFSATVSESARYEQQAPPTLWAVFEYPVWGIKAKVNSASPAIHEMPLVEGMTVTFYAENPGTALGGYRCGLWKDAYIRYGKNVERLTIQQMKTIKEAKMLDVPLEIGQYVEYKMTYGQLIDLVESPVDGISLVINYVAGRSHQRFWFVTYGSADVDTRSANRLPFRLVSPLVGPEAFANVNFAGRNAEELWLFAHLVGVVPQHGSVDQKILLAEIERQGLIFNSVCRLPARSVQTAPAPPPPTPPVAPTTTVRSPLARTFGSLPAPEIRTRSVTRGTAEPLTVEVLDQTGGFSRGNLRLVVEGHTLRVTGSGIARVRFAVKDNRGWMVTERNSRGEYVRSMTINWYPGSSATVKANALHHDGTSAGTITMLVTDNGGGGR
ncbi:hypothetical protein [Candidatus Magnetobacterium casense]|uniref:Secreted protein n=1 Tax=Candidatus Magnetobacterium casense TaxID=1455061 RepID=A0ABS6S3M6_9BACT|nr:hypothetical protein [Candidatus Magnetobacterium casensis]MBV6343453.1 hypothetical protein [Candidatus Magnetobacterium casensis]